MPMHAKLQTLVLALMLCGGILRSEEAAPPVPPGWDAIEALLQNLAADKYTVRETATVKLAQVTSVDLLGRLQELSTAADEDPEARVRASRLMSEMRERLGDALYSKDFYVLGPLPFPEDDFQWGGENKPEWLRHACVLDGVKAIDPAAKFKIKFDKGKHTDGGQGGGGIEEPELAWQRPHQNGKGTLDFRVLFPDCPNYASAFALTFIRSRGLARAKLHIGSDDGVAVWVNGACVHWNSVHRGVTKDQDVVDVTLCDGWNPVVLRVHQGWGGWGLALRATDLRGRPLRTEDIDPACGGEALPFIPAPANPPVEAPPAKAATDASAVKPPNAKE